MKYFGMWTERERGIYVQVASKYYNDNAGKLWNFRINIVGIKFNYKSMRVFKLIRPTIEAWLEVQESSSNNDIRIRKKLPQSNYSRHTCNYKHSQRISIISVMQAATSILPPPNLIALIYKYVLQYSYLSNT